MPHNNRKVNKAYGTSNLSGICCVCDKHLFGSVIKDTDRAEKFRTRIFINHMMREHALTRQESLDLIFGRSEMGYTDYTRSTILYEQGQKVVNHHNKK